MLRSSPHPREQAVTVLLDRGVEQLYCLLLKHNYGDEARERLFRVRNTLNGAEIIAVRHVLSHWNHHDEISFIQCDINTSAALLQVMYKVLKSERVPERNKLRIKLKDSSYLGLVCSFGDVPITMTTVRCLYEQVLATGKLKKRWAVVFNLCFRCWLVCFVVCFVQIPILILETCWQWRICPIAPTLVFD